MGALVSFIRSFTKTAVLMAICAVLISCGSTAKDGDNTNNDNDGATAPAGTTPTETPTPDLDSPSIISAKPTDRSTLSKTNSIQLIFSESMETSSLTLTGTMSDESGSKVWSTTTEVNDTLLISPTSQWSLGTGTLNVSCNDMSGNSLSKINISKVPGTINLTYGVQVVYVSEGVDGDGTMDSPFGNINTAIAEAVSKLSGKWEDSSQVHVSEGNYDVESGSTHVELAEGVSLYGGFSDSDWTDQDISTYISKITDTSSSGGTSSEPTRTIEANANITSATHVIGLNVFGGDGSFTAAIFNHDGGSPTLSENAVNGGSGTSNSYGIYNLTDSSPIIENNTVNGGDGAYSYAIYSSQNSEPKVYNNTLDGGSGSNDSTAIYSENCTSPKIYNNTIDGGDGATDSYGVYNASCSPTIRSNTIDGGAGDGYGIFNDGSSPAIENNIIFTSSASGYGIYEQNASADPDSVKNNNLFDCPTALFHDNDTSSDLIRICSGNVGNADCSTTLSTPSASENISEDLSSCLDADFQFDPSCNLDDYTFESDGLDGAALGWSFNTDKLARERVGDGSTGWSMGAFEYN